MSDELRTDDFGSNADGGTAGDYSASPFRFDNMASNPEVRTAARVVDPEVFLPAGAVIDRLDVDGRNLIIVLADGSQIVVPDGALEVPTLVVGNDTIPAENVAALLVGNEPEPAAGAPESSGGNFFVQPTDIQAAFELGDLLPFTELPQQELIEEEIIPGLLDEEPDIVIDTPDSPAGVTNATAAVDEAGLPSRGDEPEGTNAPSDVESTSGLIVFTSPDGLASLSLNGVNITSVGQTIAGSFGSLTITSINFATGEVGFNYVLTDNVAGDGSDDFLALVTDTDGDQATATLTISIVDDGPVALDDSGIVEGGTFGPVVGNVLANDVSGADDFPASGGVTGFSNASGTAGAGQALQGAYGVLNLNADGSYSYARDASTPGGVEDVFSYQIVDQDGSTSSATLTITIEDTPAVITFVPQVGDGTVVSEKGLPNRDDEPAGTGEIADQNPSNDSDGSETTSATVTFSSPDGLGSLIIEGVAVDFDGLPQTITTDSAGTLVITDATFDPLTGLGSFSYVYTLTDNTAGDNTSVSFDIVVTDLDGDEAADELVITIIDDEPEAQDDLGAAGADENAPVTINVIANDTQGADAVADDQIALVEGSLTGVGGVVYNGDGTFTYTPAPGEEGEVTFQYTITDGDGDVSTATVTVVLAEDSVPSIAIEGGNTVDEAGLPARSGEPEGSAASTDVETTAGTIAIVTGGDTLQSLVINGVDVTDGGIVTTPNGVLSVSVENGLYSYVYTLSDNALVDPDSDVFSLVATDSDGDTAATSLTIAILDDVPDATDDANVIAAGEFGPVGDNVLANDTQGADAASVTAFSGMGGDGGPGDTVQGTYGTLTIAGDGTYSYARDPGAPGGVSDTFSYTITDGDGDVDTANLVISIADSPVTLDLPAAGEAGTLVDEAGLAGPPAGSDAGGDGEFASGVFAFTAPDGPAVVTIDGVAITSVGQTFSGTFGTLTITSIADGTVGYEYELTSNTSGDDTFDNFTVRVTDQDGDFREDTLQIDIVDDEPIAINDTDSVTEDGPLVASGNLLTDAEANGDNGTDTTGADGATVDLVSSTTVSVSGFGAYGNLVVFPDGSYTYTLDNSRAEVQGLDGTETLTETYTYTIRDGDGDLSEATLTITINGQDDPVVINDLFLNEPEGLVDEDDLPAGSDTMPGSLVSSGTFSVDALDGLATLTIGGISVFGEGVAYPVTIDGEYGRLTISGVTPVTDVDGETVSLTVNWEFELDQNTLDHTVIDSEDSVFDSFDVVATDTDGSPASSVLDIEVVDDVPTANDDTAIQAAENQAFTIDALINDVFGADGVDTGDGTRVFVSSNAAQGTVSYDPATGLFTYTPAPGAGSTSSDDSFEYTIIDADGDTSTATVHITLQPDSEPQGGESLALLDDDGLSGGNSLSTVGDLAANTGDLAGDNDESGFSGFLSFDVGNDAPAAITFDPALNGETQSVGQETVTYTVAGATLTGTVTGGSRDGTDLFTIEITDGMTGAYTVTLLDNVLHTPGNDENDAFVSIDFVVTDSDGDATATNLTVVFDDDAPTVVADTDSVAEDGTLIASGNVVTDAESNGDNGADSPGADDASVTAVSFGLTAGTVGSPLAGAYGSLVLSADGGYTYTLDNDNLFVQGLDSTQSLTEVFTYTLTDADGDPATTTLTITINGADDDVTINGLGLDPAELVFDEDDLADGSSPDANHLTQSGTFNVVSPDGLTLLTVGGQTLFDAGNAVVYPVTIADPVYGVLTITGVTPVVDGNGDFVSAEVSYTYTLQDNSLRHDDSGEDNFIDSYEVIAIDTDNSMEIASLDIQVIDDVPAVTLTGLDVPVVQTDDTLLNFAASTSASGDFSTLFSLAYNADGEAVTNALVYDISINGGDGTDSELNDAVTDENILLRQNGNTIEAYLEISGDIAFTLALDPATGVITQTQFRAIEHDNSSDPIENGAEAERMDASLIALGVTITDGDGDEAGEAINIGDAFTFADDGVRSIARVGLEVDEDSLPGGAEDSAPGDDVGLTTASGLFSIDFGADGPGIDELTLAVDIVRTSDFDPATLTSGGAAVQTIWDAATNTLSGYTSDIADPVFTAIFDLNAEIWTFTLFQPLDHPLTDDGTGSFEGFEDNVEIFFSITARDGDGDTFSSIGLSVSIDDDMAIAVSDTAFQATENTAFTIDALMNDVFGADGVDISNATKVFVSTDASQGTVTYDTTTGSFTYTPDAGAGSNGDTADFFEYTIIDGDGDASTARVDITLQPDSTPAVVAVRATVDDDALLGGNEVSDVNDIDANIGEDPATDSEAVYNGRINVDFGEDGGTVTFANLHGTTVQVGIETVTLSWDEGSRTLTATGPRGELFSVELAANGTYTVTLTDNVLHAAGNEELSAADVVLNYRALDGDGDVDESGTLTVEFNDDAPTAFDNAARVDEGGTVAGNILTDGTADAFGADGLGGIESFSITDSAGATVTILPAQFGVPLDLSPDFFFTLNVDGSYVFQSKTDSVDATTEFDIAYTIVDGDGDRSTATLTVTVDPATGMVSDNDVLVNEAGLAEGSSPLDGTQVDADGQITVVGATSTLTYSLNGAVAGPGADEVQVDGTFGTIVLNTVTGAYTYTLDTPFTDMVDENGANQVDDAERFTYEVRDANGNLIGMSDIIVSIIDDIPIARDDANSVSEGLGNTTTGNVYDTIGAGADDNADTIGADIPGAGFEVTGVRTGTEGAGGALTAVSGATVIAGTYGNLTINPDGSYSYELTVAAVPDVASESFTYQITDNDGDTDLAELVITIDQDLRVPDIAGSAATVFEDGLADGVQHGADSETATGTFLVTNNGEGVTFTLTADNGSTLTDPIVNDMLTTDIGVLTITAIADNGDGTVTYSYSYTLSAPLAHSGQGEINPLTDTITTSITDATGDSDATPGSIVISIVDDIPVANPDTDTVAEGGTATGNVIDGTGTTSGNAGIDVPGADGFASPAVVGVSHANQGANDTVADVNGNFELVGDFGTLTLNQDGSYSYTVAPNTIDANQTDVFVYAIVDGDGDVSQATLTFSITAVDLMGNAPSVLVFEEALDTVQAGADVAAGMVTGSNPAEITETATGIVVVAGATEFGLQGGTSDGMGFTTLVGSFGTMVINEVTGDFTYTLTSPVTTSPSANDGVTTEFGETFTYTALDGNGNSVTGIITANVVDDVPTALAPDSATLINTAGSMSALFALDTRDGDVGNNYGADGPGVVIFTAASISALEAQGLQSGFSDLAYAISADGTVITATRVTDGSEVFQIELQPTGGADQYRVTLSQPLDATSDINFNDGTFDFVGGNDPWAGFVPSGQSQFVPGGGTPIPDGSSDLLLTPIATGNTADSINGTANGAGNGGIGGQNIDPGEGIRLDFVIDLTGNPAGNPANYDGNINQQDHSFSGHDLVNGTSLTFGQGSRASLVRFRALNVVDGPDNGPAPDLVAGTGTTATINRIVIEYDGEIEAIFFDPTETYPITVTVGSPGGLPDRTYTVNFINDSSGRFVEVNGVMDTEVQIAIFAESGYQALTVFNVSGDDFELSGFGTSTISNDPVNFSVPISIRDGDGDIVDAGTLDVVANPAVAPVVLDIDGGGNQFLSLNEGVAYDYDGDGTKVQTAWIAAGSAILAFDLNNDGVVTNAGEFVFGTADLTDLEAIAVLYDTNRDGVLDAQDSSYDQFGIWLDADLDAVSDPGEFTSLTDAGIVSINLVSDGILSSAGEGDVVIKGTASFTTADGSVGVVSDAAFGTGQTVELAAMDALLLLADSGQSQNISTPLDTQDLDLVAELFAGEQVDDLIEHFAQNDLPDYDVAVAHPGAAMAILEQFISEPAAISAILPMHSSVDNAGESVMVNALV